MKTFPLYDAHRFLLTSWNAVKGSGSELEKELAELYSFFDPGCTSLPAEGADQWFLPYQGKAKEPSRVDKLLVRVGAKEYPAPAPAAPPPAPELSPGALPLFLFLLSGEGVGGEVLEREDVVELYRESLWTVVALKACYGLLADKDSEEAREAAARLKEAAAVAAKDYEFVTSHSGACEDYWRGAEYTLAYLAARL